MVNKLNSFTFTIVGMVCTATNTCGYNTCGYRYLIISQNQIPVSVRIVRARYLYLWIHKPTGSHRCINRCILRFDQPVDRPNPFLLMTYDNLELPDIHPVFSCESIIKCFDGHSPSTNLCSTSACILLYPNLSIYNI